MPTRSPIPARPRRRRRVAAVLLIAVAAAAGALLAALATAKSLTLTVAKNASVVSSTATRRETIVVNARGRAVYELLPETVHHPLCTQANQCFSFWPPVTVASARAKPTTGSGVKGKLGVWHRDGIFQVTLGGHPLYTFSRDTSKNVAHGEGINGFGGTWHVIRASTASAAPQHSTTPTTSSPTTSSTATATTPYPPGY